MKIWIDLTNSPHVNFFAGMIRELQQDHHLLLTCRPLANTIDLLELHRLPYHVVGKHYGRSRFLKACGFIVRVFQLYAFLRRKSIDVATSHSSFYSPIVSWLLGIRCIYLNDNEHAAGNRISFIFSDKIIVPEYLNVSKVQKQWAHKEKIIRYPGVKEGIYLCYYQPSASRDFKVSSNNSRDVIFIRPEPWTAQYYKGKVNFIDDTVISLKDKFRIVLLPRGKLQEQYYRQQKFAGIMIPEKSVGLQDIMENCDLFIGAGGTMTREAAVLGIPTISVYQDTLLDVDKYLIKRGLMVHKSDLDAEFVANFLRRERKKLPDKSLLKKGKEAYGLIKKTMLSSTS